MSKVYPLVDRSEDLSVFGHHVPRWDVITFILNSLIMRIGYQINKLVDQ
jgi:hypothetical protein